MNEWKPLRKLVPVLFLALLGAFLGAFREGVCARGQIDPVEHPERVSVRPTDDAASHDGETVHDRPRDRSLPTRYS
jgi:hypothetical protein